MTGDERTNKRVSTGTEHVHLHEMFHGSVEGMHRVVSQSVDRAPALGSEQRDPICARLVGGALV